MYLKLDDYHPYYDKQSDIFETKINKNLRCIHGYANYVAHNDLITWVSKNSREIFIPEFSQSGKIIPFPRTIISNNFEQMNVLGDTFNSGGSVEHQEYCEFTASFFKISPTVIDDTTKNKLMNMQLGI